MSHAFPDVLGKPVTVKPVELTGILAEPPFPSAIKTPSTKSKGDGLNLLVTTSPQGSEVPGLYFGASRIQSMSLGTVPRAVPTTYDIRQTESLAQRLGKFVLSVVEFFGEALLFLFVGLETGLTDGAVIPSVLPRRPRYPEVFLLGDGVEFVDRDNGRS